MSAHESAGNGDPFGDGVGPVGRTGAEQPEPTERTGHALPHGPHLTTVRVDWLAATVRVDDLKVVGATVSEAIGCSIDEWTTLSHGMMGYETMREGPGRARILSSPGRHDTHIILPGQACGVIGEGAMRRLFAWIEKHGGPTRIDLAMDDFGERYRPRLVREEFNGPTAVTRAKRSRWSDDKERNGTPLAETVYIGSAKSDRSLKVYDKALESEGRIKAIRWEVLNRRYAARAVLAALAQRQDWGNVFAEFLVGFIDFRVDGERCAWFRELVADAEAARIPRPSRLHGIPELTLYLRNTYGPSLALVLAAEDGDARGLVRRLELDGQRHRWTPKQRRILAEELWRKRRKRLPRAHPSRRARKGSKG